jgi:4-hydroxy-tetrahydrodipicolinate synthase
MKTPVFTGASVAIVTPFRKGKVDFDKFAQLIEFQIAAGTDCICVCGTTGEAATQTMEEHKEVIRFAVKQVAGRAKVLAGTGSNCTATALELSLDAQEAGADALLVVTPYYNKTTQRGLIQHYTYLADRVNIPIVCYNVPSRTGMCFAAETYKALSQHPMINGVKEASGNFDLVAHTRLLCGDDFNIWSGEDAQVVPMMALGGKGVISVVSNVAPKLMVDMTHLALEGNFAEAAKIQIEQVTPLADALFMETNPIPVKEAMNLMGMDVGELRMPLFPMSDANRDKLCDALKKAELL